MKSIKRARRRPGKICTPVRAAAASGVVDGGGPRKADVERFASVIAGRRFDLSSTSPHLAPSAAHRPPVRSFAPFRSFAPSSPVLAYMRFSLCAPPARQRAHGRWRFFTPVGAIFGTLSPRPSPEFDSTAEVAARADILFRDSPRLRTKTALRER
uniref:Uncharacterized protein n=1 Tax=Plectus sambesii TaxID=2011161 RepID=A0A914ULI5_9BILA